LDHNQVNEIDLDSLESGKSYSFKLNMTQHALGEHWQIPIMIMKGAKDGPTLGITAALHGNELNGISIIHKLWDKIDPQQLCGTLFAVPVVNAPGFLNGTREFSDGADLNRIMPGVEDGTESQVYASVLVEKVLKKFDYLIDLHTASVGRINSLYVRADLRDKQIQQMAYLQEPRIIVNKPGEEGTWRGEAQKLGISAITVEVGDPNVFQRKHVRPSIFGINNVLVELGMINEELQEIDHDAIICDSSYWIYAQNGGILRVLPELTDRVSKGELVATIVDIFGNVIEEIEADEDGVVVAKATNPVCQVGSRVIHLGVNEISQN
jgi:predicted deacylase